MQIDLDFVFEQCPAIRRVPRVVVLHGDGRASQAKCVREDRERFCCLQPPTERYGTHHSKMMIVVRPERLVVSIVTANLIFSDWGNKTNGVWTGSFPRRPSGSLPPGGSAGALGSFGSDLLEYYEGVRALGMRPPPGWSPRGSEELWQALDLTFIGRYDFSASRARLLPSLPGRHSGDSLRRWGHMRLRALLEAEAAAKPKATAKFASAPLLMQFSSLSSPGTNPGWLAELVRSFCGAAQAPSAVQVVYPTQAEVGGSLEGWVAGTSIPCSVDNAERLRERLDELPSERLGGTSGGPRIPRGSLCSWDGGDTACGGASGRKLAVPHIKTYCRYLPEDRSVAWFALASHNLSQAAWGKLEKGGTQVSAHAPPPPLPL